MGDFIRTTRGNSETGNFSTADWIIKMFRRLMQLKSSDSPFRYGYNVKVTPQIATKRFGEDVLLFASANKLYSIASDVLEGSLMKEPSKAFWEIFAKRVNESVHLLDGKRMVAILMAFETSAGRSDLMEGLCHFVSEDLTKLTDITKKYSSLGDIIKLGNFIGKHSANVSRKCYENILVGFINLSYMVQSREDAIAVMKCLTSLKAQGNSVPDLETLLVKRLSRRIGLPVSEGCSLLDMNRVIADS